MTKTISWIIVVAAAVTLAWYWSVRQDRQALEDAEVLPDESSVFDSGQPVVEHPVEQIPSLASAGDTGEEDSALPSEPLPPLEESDDDMQDLAAQVGGGSLVERLVADNVVSRVVATVDSLTSAQVAPLMSPVQPAPGRFQVLGEEDALAMSPQNAARYQPYVDILTSLDTEQAAGLYRRYYPLFQEAYEAQGYPDGYFNDRLVEVIDHLLEAPEPRRLLELRQNEAVYEFADERYESLSAGQKMMIRLGPENERVVKEKLREIRAAIAGTGADVAD